MRLMLLTSVLVVAAPACGDNTWPALPRVVLTFDDWGPEIAEDAEVWEQIGFDVVTDDPGQQPVCAQRWYDYEWDGCEIRVRIKAASQLDDGAVGRALRGLGEIWILDTTQRPGLVLAHELGHIVLNTGEHVDEGLMSATTVSITFELTDEDLALACKAAGIGC